jgi:hypothetical protein
MQEKLEKILFPPKTNTIPNFAIKTSRRKKEKKYNRTAILFVLKFCTIVILMTFVNQQEKCVQPKKKIEKLSLEDSIIFRPFSIFQAFSFTKPFLNVSWGWRVGSPI